jgi:polyisoprenoid-binding protein YceI
MSTYKERLISLLAVVAFLLPALPAWAQWELDSTKSTLNFVSIKNDTVAEVHSFRDMVGYISTDGTVQLTVALGSVDTLIEIRDQRMRELLFETVTFPSAKVAAAVDPKIIGVLAQGGTITTDLNFSLSLHGAQKSLTVPVVLIGESEERIQVFTTRPVIVNAADFGLEAGIAALQKVAGLNAISTAVPVTVHLVFRRTVAAN